MLRWTAIITLIAVVIGLVVAFFLSALNDVTQLRWQHPWLLFALPFAGMAIVWLYQQFGKGSDAGNNQILSEIHEPGGGVPARMTPFVLLGTIVTHLFGGSAGREGTAVQMGGSISAFIGRMFKLNQTDMPILLMGGVAAGFGAVFGTPVAGAVFAMEVLVIGRIQYNALLPCLMAGVIANYVCLASGIEHTHYQVNDFKLADGQWLGIDLLLLGKIILVGIAFGLVARLFSQSMSHMKDFFKTYISKPLLVPLIGGLLIIALTYVLGTTSYLGLGVEASDGVSPSIVNAFNDGGVTGCSWFWKLIFTVITLSAGFKGGEVTPLFFIGAALGNTLAILFQAPVDLFAALGFIAVFAGASNTPLACTILGAELFGGQYLAYYAIVCFTAYYFSGNKGIYSAQQLGVKKESFYNEKAEV